MTRVGFEPTPADADEKPRNWASFRLSHTPWTARSPCRVEDCLQPVYITRTNNSNTSKRDFKKISANNDIVHTPRAFFHLCPPISPRTRSTSVDSIFNKTRRSPGAFFAATDPSSISIACEANNESRTKPNSINVGRRVESESLTRMFVYMIC